jgi:transposase-like protein
MPLKRRFQHSVFRDDSAARQALENLRWPGGYRCVSCDSPNVETVGGEKHTHRDGLLRCKDCRKQFTVTVNTVFHRSKVPLSKWMQVIHLENAGGAENSWQMAQATGLAHKTIEKMRARIHAAVGAYRGPNTIFGNPVRAYVRQERPSSYQRPPKVPKVSRNDDPSAHFRGLRRWYAWRAKNPLAKKIEAPGVLAKMDEASRAKLVSTERLLLQLLSVQPVPMVKRRRKSKKLPARHLGWLKAPIKQRTQPSTTA